MQNSVGCTQIKEFGVETVILGGKKKELPPQAEIFHGKYLQGLLNRPNNPILSTWVFYCIYCGCFFTIFKWRN